jgi:acyl carrier protein
MTTMDKLTNIVRMVFEDDEISIDRKTTAHDVDGWDSLSHVNLIVAVENSFGIRFTQKELLKFRNVGDLLDSIDSKIV